MIDAYHMIVVNIIASIALALGLIVYRLRYPDRKINLLYLLLLISILPLISILRKGSYQSGDLSLHVKYAMQFYDNILQGNLIPRWIGNHCANYGCPEFIFIFSLPYYLISILHFLGVSFLFSVKLLVISTFLLSGIGMYYWVKSELDEKAAFVASLFYQFAPYHLIDMHFRVSIGELVSIAILPFIFLLAKLTVEKEKMRYFSITTLLYALLILSHQATSIIATPFLLIYSLIEWRRSKAPKNLLFRFLMGLTLAVLITGFYWIPILAESKYIFYGQIKTIDFHSFFEFIYSPHRFGLLFQGHMGQLYFNVGYAQWITIVILIYLLVKGKIAKKEKYLSLFALTSFSVLFFMMQKISLPLWNTLSFLKNIQFSWRLMIEEMLFTALIAGIVAKNIKSRTFLIIICIFAVMYTILNWGNRKTEPLVTDSILRSESVFTDSSSVELTTPVWAGINFNKKYVLSNGNIEIVSGSGKIITLQKKQTTHIYLASIQNNSLLKENTFYYPGWVIKANGVNIFPLFNSSKYPGVILFRLKPGIYKIEVKFKDSDDRRLAEAVSVFGISLFLVVLFLFPRLSRRLPNR